MVCLIKTFQRLHKIRFKADTIRGHTIFAFSSTIKYWTMINEGGRFLVDGGTSGDNYEQQQQQISLNLWSNLLQRAYNKKKNATPMFCLLRHWYPHFLSSLSSSPSFKLKPLDLLLIVTGTRTNKRKRRIDDVVDIYINNDTAPIQMKRPKRIINHTAKSSF